MKRREDIVQKFSTFLSFRDHNSGQTPIWQVDLGLERSMKRLVQSEPEAKEEFWARYFLKVLREVSETQKSSLNVENPLSKEVERREALSLSVQAQRGLQTMAFRTQDLSLSSLRAGKHLSAYLQEACLWAAQKTSQRFRVLRHKYPLEEYFQIANASASSPEKLFKSFNFQHHQTNIEGYARTALIRFIKNTIYCQDLEVKREKFSDYGLLKDLNNKELKEALVSKGVSSSQIDLYRIAWQCFDEICQPLQRQGSSKLEPPDQKYLKQIADYYNQRCSKLAFSTEPASGEKIEEMLSTCIKAARDYRTRRFLPLEDYDNVCDSMPTLWDTVMQEEEWCRIQEVILKLFQEMPEPGQIMLKLGQGLNLTQAEIAIVLRNKYPELQKQYQVARQLKRYIKNLLREFAREWSRVNQGICLDDEKDIERLKEAMSDCLQSYCQKVFYSVLERIGKQYSDEEKMLIFLNRLRLNEQIVANLLKLSLSEVSNRRLKVKQSLVKAFYNELETSMHLATDSLQLVNEKVAVFVDEWL